VFVSKIVTTKMKSVEMMYGDKNDAFLMLKFADKWTAQTETQWEGGSDVTWEYNETTDVAMKWKATTSELQAGLLSVTAMDANKMTASKLIGEGQQQLKIVSSLRERKNTEIIVDVPLMDKKGKTAGSVTVYMQLLRLSAAPAEVAAPNPNPNPSQLEVSQSSTSGVSSNNEIDGKNDKFKETSIFTEKPNLPFTTG
jgi:hypothetical protein